MRRRFDNGTKKEILCKRVVRAYDLAQRVARKEVQEPRFLLALLPTFPVGALRKYAGGIFLASDLGGYAAVASIWGCTARRKWAAEAVLVPWRKLLLSPLAKLPVAFFRDLLHTKE